MQLKTIDIQLIISDNHYMQWLKVTDASIPRWSLMSVPDLDLTLLYLQYATSTGDSFPFFRWEDTGITSTCEFMSDRSSLVLPSPSQDANKTGSVVF
jgi:hypothetical protein